MYIHTCTEFWQPCLAKGTNISPSVSPSALYVPPIIRESSYSFLAVPRPPFLMSVSHAHVRVVIYETPPVIARGDRWERNVLYWTGQNRAGI